MTLPHRHVESRSGPSAARRCRSWSGGAGDGAAETVLSVTRRPSSDGTVAFEGRQYTKTKGTATGHISVSDFHKLASEFEKIDYFSLPDEYKPGSKVCPQVVTDMPSANTSVHLNGKFKSVAHYYGCGNSGALGKLTALEAKIDEVAGTQKWVK